LIQKTKPTPDETNLISQSDEPLKVEDVTGEAEQDTTQLTEGDAVIDEEIVNVVEETLDNRSRRDRQKKNKTSEGEEYLKFGDSAWKELKECYQLNDSFQQNQLFTRSETAKTVSIVTSSVSKELLPAMKALNIKVVYAGIKIFERHDVNGGDSLYRLTQAGAHIAQPYMGVRKISVGDRDFQYMLERRGELLQFDNFSPELRDTFKTSDMGSFLCSLKRDDGKELTVTEYVLLFSLFDEILISLYRSLLLNIVVWRGRNTVNVMAAKPDGLALTSTLKALGIYNPTIAEEVKAEKQARSIAVKTS